MATSAHVAGLSPAKATLLAAHFAASADLKSLRSLISSHTSTLHSYVLLRVLLCLPETTDPSLYTPFLKSLLSGNLPDDCSKAVVAADLPTASSPITNLSEKTARRKADKLPPLPTQDGANKRECVTSFLLQRSRNIDSETGALSIVKELLTPFRTELPEIDKYLTGAVEVLSKLVYEYALEEEGDAEEKGDDDIGGLAAFGALSADVGAKILLSHCGCHDAVRDLEILVVPYLNYKGNDVAGWSVIWAWLAEKAESGDWSSFVEIVTKWDGPMGSGALRDQYARFAIAGCYICRETGNSVWEGMRAIQRRVTSFIESDGMGREESGYKAPARLGDLLDKSNLLTAPSIGSLELLDLLITSAGILSLPLAAAAEVKLEGSHNDQKTLLVRYVRSGLNWTKRSDDEWKKVRDGVRWLRTKSRVLEKLSAGEVEKVLLAGMLAATRFALVKEIYINGRGGTLGREDVEHSVLDAFQEFYDNASNGNRTRGNMKNALSTLQILYPHTSRSTALERASRLLSATHALSHYSLTLTPGVPLLPVQIRIHPDPLSLLARLLDSNSKAYTQADSLITIAKDLAFGTTGFDGGRRTDARVLGMCVEAALSESDFETAYSFAISRLVSMASATEDTEDVKDVIWRTCFQAGRYRSLYATLAGDTVAHSGKALRTVEMRMELLAQALRVCPLHALTEVLAVWRSCEEALQMGLKEEEEEEEERHVAIWGSGVESVGSDMMGSRGRKEDEAPMGLFAVARGAAQAFRGSAFPLGVGRGGEMGGSEYGGETAVSQAAEEQRTRKRDMVSGMVTHGLASGLGWVLGAQPNVPGR